MMAYCILCLQSLYGKNKASALTSGDVVRITGTNAIDMGLGNVFVAVPSNQVCRYEITRFSQCCSLRCFETQMQCMALTNT